MPVSNRIMSRFGNLELGDHPRESRVQAQFGVDERKWSEEAHAAFSRGEFEQALRAFAKVIEFNPKNVSAWIGQVRMLIELGEFQQARKWADTALERFPDAPELLAAKAVTLARLGDLQAAMVFSDAAIEGHGETPYLWLARGDVLLAGDGPRSEYCFAKALAAAPTEWIWPWLASRVHFYYKKFSLALKLVSQALALDAGQAVVWLQMGKCQIALGLASAAQTSIDQARQLDPRSVEGESAVTELRVFDIWDRVRGHFRRWLRR